MSTSAAVVPTRSPIWHLLEARDAQLRSRAFGADGAGGPAQQELGGRALRRRGDRRLAGNAGTPAGGDAVLQLGSDLEPEHELRSLQPGLRLERRAVLGP